MKKSKTIYSLEVSIKKSLWLLFTLLAIFILTQTSCKKFVQIPVPVNQLVSSTVFTNDATASSAMAGIYGSMVNSAGFAGGSYFSVTNLTALSSDEFVNYSSDPNLVQFYKNSIQPNNSYLNTYLWQEGYQYILYSNKIIEGLNNSTGVSVTLKNQLIGEAKFVRAFCHFYLVNLFGNIPVVITSDYQTNSSLPRSDKSKVYQQIINDLTDAQSALAIDYSFSNGERVRPNKWAATALLARVYLYTNDFPNAEKEATLVINNSSLFSLVGDLNKVFLANSNETIWQLEPLTNSVTGEGGNFILEGAPSSGAAGSKVFSTEFLNAFETNDNRFSNWIGRDTSGSNIYYFPFKYKVKTGGGTTTEYSMVLRLAEQYLIRAEARAQQDNIVGANSASTDLNIIRNRAGLANYTGATDKAAMLTAILHERQVELFSEWGHRWFDLKRTNTINTVMSQFESVKQTSWNPDFALYPIPQVQITNDPNMANSQNPGY